MLIKGLPAVLCVVFYLTTPVIVCAQQTPKADTFFLVKKKGWLGKLGKSISHDGTDPEPVKKINPYLQYSGKIIRSIRKISLGFERDINDSTKFNRSFGVIVANGFHKNTTETVITNNLFFRKGDIVNPYLLADNERNLREQPFLQDALIKVYALPNTLDSVDVVVVTKDVFSIGGSLDISNASRYRVEVKDENAGGTGSRVLFSTLYDSERNPKFGYGAELLKRNIRGSFVNWTAGFQTFKPTFNNGRNQEATFYTRVEKPLVTPYIPWIGALELSYNKTSNAYDNDSLYRFDTKYGYKNVDGWFGYNFGARKLLRNNQQTRVRKFIALRGLYQRFDDLPQRVMQTFDYRYSNVSAVLGSFNVFEQNFYRTNFIYGFGRNEDVPEGFNASLIGGITNKKDSISSKTRTRPYYGVEAKRSHFNKKGFFSTYTFRLGGFVYNKHWEDVDLLLNIDHFTRLKQMNTNWYYRQFYNLAFTRQFSPVLNQPLYLRSEFGLPYFQDVNTSSDTRATARTEAVFYNLKKFWGFRFAPFIFADASLIKPTNEETRDEKFYSAFGAGVRTRNENLIFGTIELRTYYFPTTANGKSNWRVELASNIRFKYNSIFIKKPDFIMAN